MPRHSLRSQLMESLRLGYFGLACYLSRDPIERFEASGRVVARSCYVQHRESV